MKIHCSLSSLKKRKCKEYAFSAGKIIILQFIFGRAVNRLREYIINFGNLKLGQHEYDWTIDEDFFKEFEYSLVKKGRLDVHLVLEKQKETLLILNFTIKGAIGLECDRCLDEFDYPVDISNRLLVKLTDKEESSEDDELIFLGAEDYQIDVSPYIYEFINIALPLRHICEEVNKECNQKMITHLNEVNRHEEDSTDPRWDQLKNIK
jgi:uncharacterized metal-binding protein YceD (DUF177 family)